ncbi:MAG: NAD(P)H-dependent oxidoreductase subunit E [Gammaproteobacteria bacterium]|nr:NAD(P)H-dependent oxidoreductase subunit E [Gammaproteobacteria bacterium]
MSDQKQAQQLSTEVTNEIDAWRAKFPAEQQRSAVLAALHAVQHHDGYVSTGAMDAVADYLSMDKLSVYEVGSFYSMFELQPVGRHMVSMCNNISCMLRGADKLVAHVENKLGIKLGETTADQRITLKMEEECLAACVGGPMMAVDGHYHEDLTVEKLDQILDALD